jgi:hypothetical protein
MYKRLKIINWPQSSRLPRGENASGRTSHTTARTGLVYGGSLGISTIALFTDDTFVIVFSKASKLEV